MEINLLRAKKLKFPIQNTVVQKLHISPIGPNYQRQFMLTTAWPIGTIHNFPRFLTPVSGLIVKSDRSEIGIYASNLCYKYQTRRIVENQGPNTFCHCALSSCSRATRNALLRTTRRSRHIEVKTTGTGLELVSKELNHLVTILHVYDGFNFYEVKKIFSNFSCMFLNPNNFFQFEF